MIGHSGRSGGTPTAKPGQQLYEALRFQPGLRLQIGDHTVDVGALRIVTRHKSARLAVKDMSLLIELVRHRSETLSHAHLLRHVWGHEGESHDISVRVAIAKLRGALGDTRKAPRYIETISRVGYRLIAPVAFLEAADPPRSASTPTFRLPRSAVNAGLAAAAGA